MPPSLELLARDRDGRTVLVCPGVGRFTEAVPAGRVLVPGQPAGVLETLGVARTLVVPPGAAGRVVNEIPERVRQPLAWGDAVYELEPVGDGEGTGERGEGGAAPEAGDATEGLLVRSTYAGRFWRRPGPNDPAFAEPGTELTDGTPLGLIEVMKTFTHVGYRSGGELPARARVVAFHAGDGDEVSVGTPLVEIEPA